MAYAPGHRLLPHPAAWFGLPDTTSCPPRCDRGRAQSPAAFVSQPALVRHQRTPARDSHLITKRADRAETPTL
jgi:hypothetical protein